MPGAVGVKILQGVAEGVDAPLQGWAVPGAAEGGDWGLRRVCSDVLLAV